MSIRCYGTRNAGRGGQVAHRDAGQVVASHVGHHHAHAEPDYERADEPDGDEEEDPTHAGDRRGELRTETRGTHVDDDDHRPHTDQREVPHDSALHQPRVDHHHHHAHRR